LRNLPYHRQILLSGVMAVRVQRLGLAKTLKNNQALIDELVE
jgi:hypothetical protein